MTTSNGIKTATVQANFRTLNLDVTCYKTELVMGQAFGKPFATSKVLDNAVITGEVTPLDFKLVRKSVSSMLTDDNDSPLGEWNYIKDNGGNIVYSFYQPLDVQYTVVEEVEPTAEEQWENFVEITPKWIVNSVEILGQVATVQLVKLAWQNRKVGKSKAEAEPVVYFWVAQNVGQYAGFITLSQALSAMPLRLTNSNVNVGEATATWAVMPAVALHVPTVRTPKENEQIAIVKPSVEDVLAMLKIYQPDATDLYVTLISERHDNGGKVIDYAIQYMKDGRKLTALLSGLKASTSHK